jgi:photosystem II stability/assembly factor-like uncharacterized protein
MSILYSLTLKNCPMKHLLFLMIPFAALSQTNPSLNALHWRNVGPANQGGRIVDIEALNGQFRKVWMATGSGGVWHSENAGTTWTSIFDNYSTASIGDIAVYQQDPSIIWVGTGEANNRNSVSWGDGVFRSIDGGKTFNNVGLNDTHQIARILTVPDNPESLYVGAIGHLWGTSGERGLFKTIDGGKSWEKLTNGLPNDPKSGCTDIIMDPTNPNIMYAAFYERLRQPWHFESGGDNGGIFKTTDGGKSWVKLVNGLPQGPTGRVGLAIYQQNPDIVMALVEAEKSDTLSVAGSGVYRSEDGGQNWTYVNTYNNRPFYYSQIRINPLDDQRVYLLTTRFMVSEDGGKTLRNGSSDEEVHGDFHAMWLDPSEQDRYYLGADKGMSITHDHGNKFQLFDNLPIAQFYRIGLDYREPYYIYGGLQDNGFYATASFTRDIRGILNDSNWKVHWGDGQYTASDPDDWRTVFTSAENGSLTKYDPVTHRITRISPSLRNITNLSEYYTKEDFNPQSPIRYNWSAPFLYTLSKTMYYAANHVFKSTDSGQTWAIISPDLTTNDSIKTRFRASGGITPDNSGAETHCTISTMAISSLDEKVIWAGTDDGQLHISRDGGRSWTSIREKIKEVPEGLWVSQVEASSHVAGRAYLTFDGHRSDHNAPYILVTENYGKSWKPLMGSLPADMVIRVVREDLVNPELLFIGTETGIWASIDRGDSWFRFMPNMPTVSVYDIAIHPRDHALVAGSHGRSLFVMDNIHALQQLNDEVLESDFHLFEQPLATLWENVSRGGQRGHFLYGGENPEVIRPVSSIPRARFEVDVPIYYFVGTNDSIELTMEISNDSDVFTKSFKSGPGLNKLMWQRAFDAKPYSADEQKQVETAFARLDTARSVFKSSMIRFQNAGDSSAVKRKLVSDLISFLNVDPSLGLIKSGTGIYQVTLIYGDIRKTQELIIRQDPLLDKE